LPGSRARGAQGSLRYVGIGIGGGIEQHGDAGNVAPTVERAEGREEQRLRTAAGGCQNGGHDGGIIAVGQGQEQEGLALGAALA
jgi:hypothetical protein